MVKVYNNGEEFIQDNDAFLKTNEHLAVFFYLDAKMLNKTDKINYALKVNNDGRDLLAVKVEPFNLILFGDESCAEELINFIFDNNYEFNHYLAETKVGVKIAEVLKGYNYDYIETLAMSFMEAREITEPSSNLVSHANENDTDEILELMNLFEKECNLDDEIKKEDILKAINNFRILKENGKIVSIAKIAFGTETESRISFVYTREEYRGKKYARKVVNTCKNEILESGKIATLNVERTNPISNHLYKSLGFKILFDQGQYRRK